MALTVRIDNSEYNEFNLIELRIPLNAPYYTGNSTEFERYDGEVEIEGVHYRYVKRKIADGELVLLCLPNDNRTRLENSRMDFFRMMNDLTRTAQHQDKSGSIAYKAFTAEYWRTDNCWNIDEPGLSGQQFIIAELVHYSSGHHTIPKQPPRA